MQKSLKELRQLNYELVSSMRGEDLRSNYLSTITHARGGLESPQLLAEIELGVGCIYAVDDEPILALKHLEKGEALYAALPAEEQDRKWIALMHNRYAGAYAGRIQIEQALHHNILALEANRELGNIKEINGDILNIGMCFRMLGDGYAALKYFRQVIKGSSKTPRNVTTASRMMGLAYELVGDLDEAKFHLEQAIQNNHNDVAKTGTLISLLPLYIADGNIRKAEQFYSDTIALIVETDLNKKGVAFLLTAEAQIAAAKQLYEDAQAKCAEALALLSESDNIFAQKRVKIQLATVLLQSEQYDACLTLLQSLSEERSTADMLSKINELRLQLYKSTEQWQLALEFLDEIRKTNLFRQSRLKITEELLDSQQHQSELRIKNAQLIALQNEKDEVLRIVSHDLKNPLGAARLTLELLESQLQNFSEEQIRKRLNRTTNVVDSTLEIVSQLDVVARAEADNYETEFETFAIEELVAAVAAENMPLAEKKQQQLVVGKLTPIRVEGKQLWVKQILANLISNAIKYSLPNAKTTVTQFTCPDQKFVCIEVADEGLGLSEDDLAQAFSKYKRLSNVPTGNESSTGLGLYIVRLLTNKMGGSISASSEGKGKGSTFTVKIPAVLANT